VTFYLWVDEPVVSQVLGEPDQKSAHIEIYKKFSTQSGPNPW